jgi:hypothetical protein
MREWAADAADLADARGLLSKVIREHPLDPRRSVVYSVMVG